MSTSEITFERLLGIAPDELPAAVLENHIAALGKTGSGKTSTTKWIIERIYAMHGARARVCVLDPVKSDWWGITASADGKSAGLPFHILGGQHGHVPLHSGAGKAIAELVADGRLPLSILDMKLFEPGGQVRFFADFAPTLLQRMEGVLYLVLEEAHVFAPKERAGFGHAENMAIHWAKMIATSGRSAGIRLLVATQRTQALHNALLGSCETMLVHRITKPEDQEPVTKWLKGNVKDKAKREEIEQSISSLSTGSAWMCSGEAGIIERVRFPRIRTFDNSATPKHGDKRVEVVAPPPVDVNALRALIANADEFREVDEKPILDDGRVARLEGQITAQQVALRNDAQAMDAYKRTIAFLTDRHEGLINALRDLVADYEGTAEPPRIDAQRTLDERAALEEQARKPTTINVIRAAGNDDRSVPREYVNGASVLNNQGPLTCLKAIAQASDGLSSAQLAVRTGYATRTIQNYTTALRTAGLIEAGLPAKITEKGRRELENGYGHDPLPMGAALFEQWKRNLDNGPRRVLEVIVASRGAGSADLSRATGYAMRTVQNYTTELKSRKLITRQGQRFYAVPELFD